MDYVTQMACRNLVQCMNQLQVEDRYRGVCSE